NDNDHNLAALIKTLKNPPPIILALNKIDLLDDEAITQSQLTYQELLPTALALPISAARSLNLGQLLEALLNHIPVSPPFYPEEQVTDLYERDIAADLIREATLRILKDEIPHGIAVRVDEYTERDDHGAYIEATLFVERDSQKGIVIGKAGAMLKQIGTTARQEIERMSGRKVFLRLRVKVRKNWRNDENFLRQFDFKKRKK
ncbi:MAG: GTPase Era, partial [Anaerolineae bacterium]|nr:GTPase Era [Anaerolineae bacterium]